MVCGPDFSIKDDVAKWPGSVHDSRIFKETALWREFENGMLCYTLTIYLKINLGYNCNE